MIEVKTRADGERGLFATKSINIGQILEEVHVIELPAQIRPCLDVHKIGDKFLAWKMLNGEVETLAIGAGSMMFCNHARKPNAYLDKRIHNQTVALLANQPISVGDEITLNYVEPTNFKT